MLRFRDYLRAHSEAAARYLALKRPLAVTCAARPLDYPEREDNVHRKRAGMGGGRGGAGRVDGEIH